MNQKQIITGLLLLTLLLNLPSNKGYAQSNITEQLEQEEIQTLSGTTTQRQKYFPVISNKLEKELKADISKIYGQDKTDEIYNRIVEIAEKAKENRPQNLLEQDLSRENDWYKDEIIYMFYVDQFGTVTPEKPNQFKDTTKMLDYLKSLGVTTIYMLPFADSPMEDSGFDVKNPQNVRKDLGGRPQFEAFIKEAKTKGFNIKADLVLNHFSDQHEWFQQALKGDLEKLNRFIVREDMPQYTKYVDPKLGTVIEYKENDGK